MDLALNYIYIYIGLRAAHGRMGNKIRYYYPLLLNRQTPAAAAAAAAIFSCVCLLKTRSISFREIISERLVFESVLLLVVVII